MHLVHKYSDYTRSYSAPPLPPTIRPASQALPEIGIESYVAMVTSVCDHCVPSKCPWAL